MSLECNYDRLTLVALGKYQIKRINGNKLSESPRMFRNGPS